MSAEPNDLRRTGRNIIALTGLPGVGKTTIGRLLGRRLNWKFRDLDAEIDRIRPDANKLIQTGNWKAFRSLELAVLRDCLPRQEKCVLALAGGTLSSAKARDLVTSRTLLAWLSEDVDVIAGRMVPNSRAMFTGKNIRDELAKLLCKREQSYAISHLTVKLDRRSPEAIATSLMQYLAGEIS